MDHPNDQALAAFVDGRLDDGEMAQVRGHLSGCDVCRDVVVSADEVKRSVTPAPSVETLLPCPFCGGDADMYDSRGISVAKLVEKAERVWPNPYVRCKGCGATGPLGGDGTLGELWNRRTPSPAPNVERIAEEIVDAVFAAADRDAAFRFKLEGKVLAILARTLTPSERPAEPCKYLAYRWHPVNGTCTACAPVAAESEEHAKLAHEALDRIIEATRAARDEGLSADEAGERVDPLLAEMMTHAIVAARPATEEGEPQ